MKRNKIIIVGGIIVASEIVWYLCKQLCRQWKLESKSKSKKNDNALEVSAHNPKQKIAEVMFFSNESILCREHVTSERSCPQDNCPVGYLRKLENYINGTQLTLDVCMYALTCHSLSNAIVRAHKRGVCVKIITDRRMACNCAAQTELFHKNGVAMHLEDSDVLMHHKFVIVDKSIVITGSTNWTMSAFFGNFDHTLITNEYQLVQPFVVEFDRLWKKFVKPRENFERLGADCIW